MMKSKKLNIEGYTVADAAHDVGISAGRIRQLCRNKEIDAELTPLGWIISQKGIKQAKARRTALGRPKNPVPAEAKK